MPTFAIVPAAGKSRRMGVPKLTLPLLGRTVLAQTLRAWQRSGVDHIVAVASSGNREIAAICRGEEFSNISLGFPRVDVVQPDAPLPEMKHTVLAALEFIESRYHPQPGDAWLLAPADMPGLNAAVVAALLRGHAESPLCILVPTHDGRRGHPVLFPWSLAAEVARLGAGEGVNALLDRHPTRTLECGPAALPLNMNTPEDYERLAREWREPE